jgi:hypothetical protein
MVFKLSLCKRCDKSDLWVRSCRNRNDSNKIFALIHPEDVEAVIEKVKTTKSKLVPQRQVSLFSSIKGLVWHEVNSLPVVELEGTVICHGIVTDITERLEEEQNCLKSIDCIHSLARLIRLLFALLMKKCF